jgi:hypothetical protein
MKQEAVIGMAEDKRTHVVMARLNSAELERLDALRSVFAMSRAKYMRTRALGDSLPRSTVVPELNRRAWAELSRAASNLNQLTHHLNVMKHRNLILDPDVEIDLITKALKAFRNRLIGASTFEDDE